MKIRLDFVTNSSSSSFVAYGIYDPELADKVEELLKKHKSYPSDSIGWISVDNDVISITRDLGDVDWHSTYKIYDELETGQKRTKTQVESDEKKALKAQNVVQAFNGFFKNSFITSEIKEKISEIVVQGGVICRIYIDETDGYDAQDFSDMSGYLKKKISEYDPNKKIEKPARTATTKSTKATPKKEAPSYNKKEFKIKNGVLVEYAGYSTDVVIPDVVNSIGYPGFLCSRSVVNVTIPDTVTSISKESFSNCDSLQNVIFGNSINNIDSEAFKYCKSLKEITLPDGITKIASGMFLLCKMLETVTIPETVELIEKKAFSSCYALSNITIPDAVKKIEATAFYDCRSLKEIKTTNNSSYKTIDGNLYSNDGRILIQYAIGKDDKTFRIPDGVAEIAEYAFAESHLTHIELPESMISIGQNAFSKCKSLVSVHISNSLTSIGEWAFSGCESLEEVNIPDSVISIGNHAFYGCKSMKKVTIPNSITALDNNLFDNCSSLSVIKIPESVTRIGAFVFGGCTNLKELIIPDSIVSIDPCAFMDCGEIFNVPCNEYENAYYLGNEKNPYVVLLKAKDTTIKECTIHSNTKFVGSKAFKDCVALEKVEMPDKVVFIGDSAFEGCVKLSSVKLSKSLIEICGSAFKKCESIKTISIPIAVEKIGLSAFFGCSSMEKILCEAKTQPEGWTYWDSLDWHNKHTIIWGI